MDKLFSMLGLALRARRLLVGRDAVMASVRAGRAGLVLLTEDASPRHRRELEALGYVLSLPCTMDETGARLGKRSCIFALEDENFITAIQKTI